MNFHIFTYNEQMILLSILIPLFFVALTIAFLLAAHQNKEEKEVSKIPWDDIFNYQNIALAINSLSVSGILTITFEEGIYKVSLKSKLGFTASYTGEDLCKVLKLVDNRTTLMTISMATRKGDTND